MQRPDWDAVLAAAVPFSVPLRMRFRGVTSREGVLLRGPSGWGEFAPFAEYPPELAARWLAAAVEAAFARWPAALRGSVPVNAIVPELPPDGAAALVRECVATDGTTTIKVKLSPHRGAPTSTSSKQSAPAGSPAADADRVSAVRAALDHAGVRDGQIRIDVNGAWTVDEAAARLPALDAAARGLEYVEQPCASLEELRALRRRTNVPIAVDEAVRLAADPDDAAWRRAVREAADVVVLKPTPLGGVTRALALAERLRMPTVVSGAMDTSVGLAAGVALAAALPDLPHACGLGTGALLAADLVGTPTRPRDGRLLVVRPAPDPALLAAAHDRLGPVAAQDWLVRMRAAWDAWDDRRTTTRQGTG